MDISRSLPRKRWTLLTAILATVAVIAALLTVPLNNASAAEPKDFKPNTTLGDETQKNPLKKPATPGEEAEYNQLGIDPSWGYLVWAGAPQIPEGENSENNKPNPKNDVGWGWCAEPGLFTPFETTHSYEKAKAKRLNLSAEYRDPAIRLARMLKSAVAKGEKGKAANYYVYLAAFTSANQMSKYKVAGTITGLDPKYNNRFDRENFPSYTGTYKEFTELTGFKYEGRYVDSQKLVRVKSIPEQPKDAYITIVNPAGSGYEDAQPVMPVDQPGLPDLPSIETEAKFADGSSEVVNGAVVTDTVTYKGLVDGKKYHLDATLMSKDGKTELGTGEAEFTADSSKGFTTVDITVKNAEEPVASAVAFEKLTSVEVDENGKDTPDADTPNEIAEHRDINDEAQTVPKKDEETPPTEPKKNAIVSTNADFENSSHEVVAGAKIVDQVSYEGLVPGKEYSLDAQLISKDDGKTVLGETKGHTFKPEAANGTEAVTITVSDDVKEPVEAAVAFETLTSKVVNDKGEDTPDNDKPNEIGEHKDIKDDDQTVTKKKNAIVSTNADFENGSKEVVGGAKIVDQVSYEGLVPGKEYSLDAQLISKKDGKTVLGETKGHTFTPEAANGTESVIITVDEKKVTEPVEAAVAFETLTSKVVNDKGEDTPDNDKPNWIGEHKDIDDDDQTVPKENEETPTTVPVPSGGKETTKQTEPTPDEGKPGESTSETTKQTEPTTEEHKPGEPWITTNADFENGSHEVVAGAKIVDEVTYEGLVPGEEYTLKAELINKKDGKSVLGTGEKTFTPEKSKGMEPVTITVNDDVTEPVEAAVAFEELTSVEVNDKGEETSGTTSEKPNHIADHKDINDKDQTVTSHKKGGKTPWWLILIPGIGLGKIIKDHFDEVGHQEENPNDSHGGKGHQPNHQDAPEGDNSGRDNGSGDAAGQEPGEVGNALPADAPRADIKSVPSGATELEPGMQSYIK